MLFLKWHSNLAIASGCRSIDRINNIFDNELYHWPLRMLKNDERELTGFQILLIANVLIRRHHDLEAGLLGGIDQIAVGEFFPSANSCFFHRVAG